MLKIQRCFCYAQVHYEGIREIHPLPHRLVRPLPFGEACVEGEVFPIAGCTEYIRSLYWQLAGYNSRDADD